MQDSWYVAHKNIENNELTVVQGSSHPLLYSDGCFVEKLHWIDDQIFDEKNLKVQIRYQSKAVSCKLKEVKGCYKIIFDKPELAVTPGQSAVLYSGEECLGGGIIKERISKDFYNWAENRGYNYQVYG